MTNLKNIARQVIEAKEKRLWAGAEFFPLKEFSAGIYLCRSPIKPDDKEVFVSDSNVANLLSRAVLEQDEMIGKLVDVLKELSDCALTSEEFKKESHKTSLVHTLDTISITAHQALTNPLVSKWIKENRGEVK